MIRFNASSLHQVELTARISLNLSPPILIIHCSRQILQNTSWAAQILWKEFLACWPALGFHWRKSLMSLSLCRQQCPTCSSYLDCLCNGKKWPYSCYFVGCCFQDLFNTAVAFYSSFFNVHLVHPYSTQIGKNSVLFYQIDQPSIWLIICLEQSTPSQGICYHPFQLVRYCPLGMWTWLLGLLLKVKMVPSRVEHMYSVLFAFTWTSVAPDNFSWLCSRDPAYAGVFARSVCSST